VLLSLLLLFETGSDYVAQAGLGVMILLPQPPKWWDYRQTSPCLSSCVTLWTYCIYIFTSIVLPQLLFIWLVSNGIHIARQMMTSQSSFTWLISSICLSWELSFYFIFLLRPTFLFATWLPAYHTWLFSFYLLCFFSSSCFFFMDSVFKFGSAQGLNSFASYIFAN
jgi:hypothetical protein